MAVHDRQFVVDFPTLFVAHDWAQHHCVVPDGLHRGDPWTFFDWQAWCLLNFYRVKPDARVGQLAPAFFYRRSQVILPQKAGKAPYTAAHICVEGVGPSLFAGWAEGGERWDCRDHGCGCGWVYEYEPGEAMGRRWPTPLIQVTAFSEDQTDNVYAALRPMIDLGPLSDVVPRTGEEFIRLPDGGRIDAVTSNAKSRLGARLTFAPQDETGIWTAQGGMIKVAETQRRGLAGMGGRAEETSNGWDPSEGSVAQRTAESRRPDIFRYHPLAPDALSYTNKAERRRIHRHVYAGSDHVDLDAIESEAAELIETDPRQAERFFGNRIVAGASKAFDAQIHGALATVNGIARGELVTLGFDGSLTDDATGLVATSVETGHQVVVGAWERPADVPDWHVPLDEVNEAVDFAFAFWQVWRMYADPPHYRDDINRWASQYGDKRVVEWWTNQRKRMAIALKAFKTDMRAGVMSHGPLDDSPEAAENHLLLQAHIANAVRRLTKFRDEDDGSFLWLVGKDGPSRKIDLVIAAVLSWEARSDAVRAGALKQRSKVPVSF